MNQNSTSTQKAHDFNIEHFRIRLTAKICIILVCLILFIPRLVMITADPNASKVFVAISLPFPVLMTFVVLLEYLLFKKLGPGIVKYSIVVDITLLLLFMADWILVVIGSANKIQQTHPVSFKIGALYGFTSFSWRTLLVTLIVQKWQLKIIAPVVAVALSTGYAIHYITGTIVFTMVTAISQIFNIIIIIYFEDKVKWKMVWANIQKDKWMQVNNFILDSLPENIMILDLSGQAKFISEYCKTFIKNCHLSLDVKDFFTRVQDLQLLSDLSRASSTVMIPTERLATENGFLGADKEENSSLPKKQILDDIVNNFKNTIIKKEINEREFQVYNGKLKIEGEQERSLEVKISFLQNFENYYIILIIRDTTQRDLLVTLEETNKYKDQLLASVSHELRAPLNGNINLVESALSSPKIPESIKETLLIPALRSSKFLLHMINDILDMCQIKEKKLRLIFNSENLKETLKSTAQLVELQAKKKGIELLLEIDPAVPKTFCTDHIRLSQIILNLVNNAIKFTSQGTVKLIAKKPLKQDPSLVQISVQDSGIGMSQENLHKLFSSYTHIEFEGRQTMNPTGIGLGLSIAYNLAVLLGPQGHPGINVTSVLGQGSTFTFTLENKEKGVPIEIQHLTQSDEEEIPEESAGGTNQLQRMRSDVSSSIPLITKKSESALLFQSPCTCPKILIVDDNPFNTMACETIFGSLEIKCDSVYSGSSCLKSLLNRQTNKLCGDNCKQYAVVFMDQEMPEMSGSDTMKEILKLQSQSLLSSSIRVIGCTAHKSKEDIDKFMEAGIEKCISKPISAVIIKEILKGIE